VRGGREYMCTNGGGLHLDTCADAMEEARRNLELTHPQALPRADGTRSCSASAGCTGGYADGQGSGDHSPLVGDEGGEVFSQGERGGQVDGV
jgi:hypothetical protein